MTINRHRANTWSCCAITYRWADLIAKGTRIILSWNQIKMVSALQSWFIYWNNSVDGGILYISIKLLHSSKLESFLGEIELNYISGSAVHHDMTILSYMDVNDSKLDCTARTRLYSCTHEQHEQHMNSHTNILPSAFH